MTDQDVSQLHDDITNLEVERQKALGKQESGHRELIIGLVISAVGFLLLILFGINLLYLVVIVAGLAWALIANNRRHDGEQAANQLSGQLLEKRTQLEQATAAPEADEPAEAEEEASK